jgi:AcrR family transcriptional regulator
MSRAGAPPPSSTPSTGRGPGGRGAGLHREAIVAAALELMDRHGVEWMSMRRLAEHLGVRVGALYWHFAKKDDLCRAVVESVVDELRWDESPDDPVIDQVRSQLVQLRVHWRRHPSVVALGQRFPPVGAGDFAEAGMALLIRLGYEPDDAREEWRALVWIVLGFFYVEGGVASSVHHRPIDDQPGRYVVDLDGARQVLDTDVLFERALDLALRGLATPAR